ncbi:hypothetical protein Ark11_1518 [Candidatus Ichthyocystis hellenicum]|uniref:Uncharacterized protein n=1 Tax=Candidatus Ichthyocystis hellenicum TaxID=1561003 RepID=A0A0S4M5R3_9BURK|nr:hypothetical protein [Candidatus Ichthyocystis hellenicum]CUT18316.1 hypothetical protein Ark11_1518 [Candidatus Ichthyocystis hellenicum]
MFYNDGKYLDYSAKCKFESQNNNEVETESGCTTVVLMEHKTNSRLSGSFSFINRSLANSCMAQYH